MAVATVSPNAGFKDEADRADKVNELALKLDAMLMHTYGESGEPFRNMHGDLQDRYLWACGDMARELVETLRRGNRLG